MITKAQAQGQIHDATQRLLGECAGASDAQWLFRPAATRWSMAHIVEHVAISNHNILRALTRGLLNNRLDGRATDVIDTEIPYLFYRGDEPPNVATPTGGWTKEAAREALRTNAQAILEWASTVHADLRAVAVAHPMFGLVDGVQWLLFAAAHTERHRAQLIGLKRHPEFPA
jgi:DinB superfamily